jgi:hypothetical protein
MAATVRNSAAYVGPPIGEGPWNIAFLLSEAEGQRSRDVIKGVPPGTVLLPGDFIAASGEKATAPDEIVGISLYGYDAKEGPIDIAAVSRDCEVTDAYLMYGELEPAVNRVTGAAEPQYDLFNLFGVQPQPLMEWPIIGAGAAAQDEAAWAGQLTGLCNTLGRAMADEVSGGAFLSIFGVCGSVFFDAFSMHPERRAAFIALDSRPIVDAILGTRISFRDVTIVEYRGKVGNVEFVEPDMAYFFPRGAVDMFVEAYAPADYLETVNTVALPRYSKMEVMDFDKGVELEAQMNVLPLCTTPRALFRARAVPYVPLALATAGKK